MGLFRKKYESDKTHKMSYDTARLIEELEHAAQELEEGIGKINSTARKLESIITENKEAKERHGGS